MSTAGKQPSRALLIAAGLLTQVVGAACFVLGLASIPAVQDLRGGMTGVIASVIAALAAIVCGTLVWRGRLIPLALAAGLDVGFGIGLPRGGSAVGAMLRMLPADDARSAETFVVIAAVIMFIAAALCVISVPAALKLRHWARNEIAASESTLPVAPLDLDVAPTRERPSFQRPSLMPLPAPPPTRPPEPFRPSQQQKLMPTQVLNIGPARRGMKPAIIIGVAVTLIAVGVIVMSATLGDKPAGLEPKVARTPSDAGTGTDTRSDAALAVAESEVDAAVATPRVEDFVTQFHTALGAGDLAPLLDANAFAIGADGNDLAEGRDPVAAQVKADASGTVTVRFSLTGQDADSGWLAEDLEVGGKRLTLTAGLARRDNVWTIAALHIAEPMPNATAYKLARDGNMTSPDVIPNTNDTSELAKAMATAFASKPSFVDARSAAPDAFNFGSAPGERLKGGETIKKIFGRINATIKLHDAVKVGALGATGGWGVANVDFTEALRDGDVTQTFRVLAIWRKEEAGWRIVVTQFSNAR